METLRSSEFTTIAADCVWNIVSESEPDVPVEEYEDIGLAGFDFDKFSAENLSKKAEDGYDYPFLKLIQEIWPGDWRKQLAQLNAEILENNRNLSTDKKWKLVSEYEWWKFIGVLVSAAAEKKGGTRLWEKNDAHSEKRQTERTNYGPDGRNIFPQYRFDQLRKVFPSAFHDYEMKARGEPWFAVGLMVRGFNEVCADKYAASVVKTLDESMSAFRPRTTKTADLPHISFIFRKPEHLGTEFKVSDHFECLTFV